MPVIAAVIPVWNRAHVAARAIASVLAQDLPPGGWSIEVTAVDDGSSDRLDLVLRGWGARVACIRHDRNRGAAAARNTGVAASRGAYVAFLDSDDVWLPGKIAAQIAFMEASGYQASCTAYMLARAQSSPFMSPRYATGTLGLADLSWGCFVSPGSTLVCRREVFAEIGGLDEALRRLEDWDWLLRYAKVHPLGFLAQPLAHIEVAAGGHAVKVFEALDRMWEKHATALPPRARRNFEAALHVERAAAHYRNGGVFAGVAEVARSLRIAPVGNRAIAAVLHNRLGRR
jgi:glycosyltransferase involved in cell wall biosynthesis